MSVDAQEEAHHHHSVIDGAKVAHAAEIKSESEYAYDNKNDQQ